MQARALWCACGDGPCLILLLEIARNRRIDGTHFLSQRRGTADPRYWRIDAVHLRMQRPAITEPSSAFIEEHAEEIVIPAMARSRT